jgi:superfamily II RNA helicase
MFTVELNQIIDNEIPSVSTSREEYEKRLDMLKEMQEDIKALVQATREMAIEDGYAEMVTGKQPELSPTRALFIELYGQEEFDRVKRLGKAKETFTWK